MPTVTEKPHTATVRKPVGPEQRASMDQTTLISDVQTILNAMVQFISDVNSFVLPPQGQSALAHEAYTASIRMQGVLDTLKNMADSDFVDTGGAMKGAEHAGGN